MLVGDLLGVDMLLGVDFLHAVKATLDFSAMTMILGPQQVVPLHITRECSENYHVSSVDVGFAKSREANTLIARHTTCVPMQRIGSHPGKVDHIFES